MIGFLKGYSWVWFFLQGIANILLLARVKRQYRVTYNSMKDNMFHLHLKNGRVRSFKESNKGLYYSDYINKAFIFINTVAHNRSQVLEQDYQRAVDARKIQSIIGSPSYQQFKEIIKNGKLRNCPIQVQDIVEAEQLFWPIPPSVKRKNYSIKNHACTVASNSSSVSHLRTIQIGRIMC